MVSITSTRGSSATAILLLTGYLIVVTRGFADELINSEIELFFLLTIGGFIAMATFNFAATEIKLTEGVGSIFDIPKSKLIGILLFASFMTVGYNSLVVILLEIFGGREASDFSIGLTIIIVSFLLIFPFFQYIFLARPGEGSSLPAEFPFEAGLEFIRSRVKSPFLAAVIAYILTYVIPFLIILSFEDVDELQAVFLVAIILPLISLGALAGAGIGEDLIRIRLLRHPFKEWRKLGTPKINIRELKFEIGGFLLVLLAIQAVITTAIFGILNILTALEITDRTAEFGAFLLFLTLFNKGRGSTKEMKEVWSEGGFKVSTFQLFLPIFVFFGVILSSALEVLVSQEKNTGILRESGLSDVRLVTALVLAIQNLVLLFTAILIYRRPPGAAERRLIKEVPKFYGDDTSGYLYIYNNLTSDRSIENLLLEINKIINKDVTKAAVFKTILLESFTSGSDRVQIAASQVIVTITKRMKKYDSEFFELVDKAFNSDVIGARIYAVRAMKNIIGFLEGIEKEDAIRTFSEKINDPDSVVSWDSSLALQKLIFREPEYRGFVLALIIKILLSTKHEGSRNAITRFLNRVAEQSDQIGIMAMDVLGRQLSEGNINNIDNVIQGIRALLRANSHLSETLLDTIAVGIENEDVNVRKDYYLVLTNLAQYGAGRDTEVLSFIMTGVTDESAEIQTIAYEALAKDVVNHPELTDEIFNSLTEQFHGLPKQAKIGALDVFEAIAKENPDKHLLIFDLLQNYANSEEPEVRADVLKIFAILPPATPSLSEEIYYLSEANIQHTNDMVRVNAIHAVGVGVSTNSGLARAVHRRIADARNDTSLRVQLSAIEALGHVAAANRELSEGIFGELKPLMNDDDWQVRLSTLSGLFVASKKRKDLNEDMVQVTLVGLSDDDRTVRSEAIDILKFQLENYRPSAELFVKALKKELKKRVIPGEVRATYYHALEEIASIRRILIADILEILQTDYAHEENVVRAALAGTLKTSVQKLKSTRELSTGIEKSLGKIMTSILKAANNSHTGIRRDAYQNIADICAALIYHKVAKRGRNAITTAMRHEKDVGLLEFLETCRIRAKPPLTHLD